MAKNQHDDVKSHLYERKWKYISIGLMGILATGLLAPQAYADTLSTIQSIVTDIQSKVNNSTYGLQALKNAITGVKTDTQIIRGDLYGFKTFAEPKLTSIETKVNALSGGGASGFKVLQGNIVSRPANAAGTEDRVDCTSSSDYTLSISVIRTFTGFDTDVMRVYRTGNVAEFPLTEPSTYILGGNAGNTTGVSLSSAGAGNVVGAFYTLQTAPGATASCILS